MKQCPYCRGEIEDQALKCQHCGEWVTPFPVRESRERIAPSSTLAEGLKWYGAFKLGQGAIGVAILLLILCVSFLPLAAFFFFPLIFVLQHYLMPPIVVVAVVALVVLFFRALRSRC